MKKKALLSSILTIALCLSLIAGSTFALFTSSSEVNVAVTSGKVEVEANITGLTPYSVKPNPISGTIVDEYGHKYDYEKQNSAFINGGTAVLVGNELTLDKVTPGDKVTFTIEIANKSDVITQYRTLVYCTSNDGLFSGLEIGLDGNTFNGFAYTEWTTLAAGADIQDVAVTVELPVTAGNEYQSTSASLCFIVEAVQGNGATAYEYLPDLDADGAYEISNAADLFIFASMVNNGVATKGELTADIDLAGKVWTPINGKGIEFDGQGHTISNLYAFDIGAVDGKNAAGLFGKTTSCYISNVNIDKATVISNHWAAGIAAYALCTRIDNCKVTNSTITTSAQKLGNKWDNGDKAGAIAGYLSAQPAASVTNCTVENVTVKGYRDIGGVVGYADAKTIVTGNTISNSTVICDPAHNYKNYTAADEFDVEAIVGDGAVDTSNAATGVEVKVPTVVSGTDELKAALDGGEDHVVVMNTTFTENNFNGRYYKDRDIDFVDCTFKANMNYMYINNATFTNCVFDCGSNNAAVHYDELFGDLVFNNCTFISGKIQIGARVEEKEIDGVMTEVILGTVTFNNCEFMDTAGTSIWSDKGIRIYSPATFNNCEFKNRVVLAGFNDLPLTFNACTMEDGKAVYYVDNNDGIIRGGNIPAVTVNQ